MKVKNSHRVAYFSQEAAYFVRGSLIRVRI
jgi:hypothetical protein